MNKQKFYQYRYHNYEVNYYLFKEYDYDDQEKILLLKKLSEFNSKTLNLKYGLFDPNFPQELIIKNLLNKMLVLTISENEDIIGYQCFFIMESPCSKKIVHHGLTFFSKNKGVNLLLIVGSIASLILHEHYSDFYISSITTVPKVVEILDNHYVDIWPSPKRPLHFVPSNYKPIVEILFKEYIKKVFPASESININYKRFTLILHKREIGFDEHFFKLPRAKKFVYNLFCQNWIDYENNEDLIVIGKFNFKTKFLLVLAVFSELVKRKLKRII